MGLFSRQVVGVDLGHASVKVVGLEVSRHPVVTGFAVLPVDAKFLQKEGFENPNLVGEALREAMHKAAPHAIKGKEAYAAVSESLIFRKILELPPMGSDAELQSVIQTEAAQYLPDSLDTVEIDYQILGPSQEENRQQVMVVAVSKRVIQDYQAVFNAAHLPLRAIDPKPSALGRAIVGPQEKNPVVVIDIGSEISSISVFAERAIWVTGTVNQGGSFLKNPETGEVDGSKEPERVKRLAGALADELNHVLKFYANRANQKNEIKEIRLAGGGTESQEVIDALQNEVDLKVTTGRPVVTVPSNFDRRFYGALGSALYPLYEML